jgi:hypothetical protein
MRFENDVVYFDIVPASELGINWFGNLGGVGGSMLDCCKDRQKLEYDVYERTCRSRDFFAYKVVGDSSSLILKNCKGIRTQYAQN